MRFKIKPEEHVGLQDVVIAEFPNIESAAMSLRAMFPDRRANEVVAIVCVDRPSMETDDTTYGLFVLGTGKRYTY